MIFYFKQLIFSETTNLNRLKSTDFLRIVNQKTLTLSNNPNHLNSLVDLKFFDLDLGVKVL